MKRALLTAAVLISVFGLLSTASAGERSGRSHDNRGSFQKYTQGFGFAGVSNLISKHSRKKSHPSPEQEPPAPPKPLDPGRGDGVEPTPPQAVPGFVWAGDHWERVRAPKKTTGPIIRDHRAPKATPIIRDHRTPKSEPTVRDHRTPLLPIVRDHR